MLRRTGCRWAQVIRRGSGEVTNQRILPKNTVGSTLFPPTEMDHFIVVPKFRLASAPPLDPKKAAETEAEKRAAMMSAGPFAYDPITSSKTPINSAKAKAEAAAAASAASPSPSASPSSTQTESTTAKATNPIRNWDRVAPPPDQSTAKIAVHAPNRPLHPEELEAFSHSSIGTAANPVDGSKGLHVRPKEVIMSSDGPALAFDFSADSKEGINEAKHEMEELRRRLTPQKWKLFLTLLDQASAKRGFVEWAEDKTLLEIYEHLLTVHHRTKKTARKRLGVGIPMMLLGIYGIVWPYHFFYMF